MDLFAILLILLSALMHAGWNFIGKSKAASAAFFAIATVASVILLAPVYIYYGRPAFLVPAPVWALLAATGFLHAFYFVSMAGAYRLHDISFVYPLARALPVVLVALTCAVINYGKPLTPPAVVGLVITAVGCIVLPLQSFKISLLRQYLHRSIPFVLLASISTTGYTIFDSMGVKKLKSTISQFHAMDAALFFIAYQTLFTAIFIGLYLLFSRSEMHHFKTLIRHSLRFPVWAGIICNVAYLLVLLAMQFAANVSYIVAFRQSSILFGVLLGFVLLKEKITVFKASGVVLIFVGLVMAAVG